MSEGPVFVASPLQPASNESQKANFNMPNSRSPKSGPAHDYPVDDPAMCGVGVYFERLEMDMAKPQIKEITPRGSAHRDGTLEAILGIAGTMVRLTMNKGNGRILEVALPRGNPEYWTQVDAAENLRKDLKVRDKEIEALRRKLRESESAMQRDRTEVDNLNVQVGSLERLSQKLQMDLEREVDQRRRAESSVASLSADKNSLEDQMEAVVKKMSESALSFKSAQGLAREMTEKARQSEQGRVMEEKLRKMAEAREAKSQALLLDEVQRRKEAEAERTLSEARYVEVSESVRHMENLNRDLAKAKAEVIDLQGQIAIAHSEIESKKEFVAKVQTENGEVRSQSGDVEVRILTIRKELRDALDRVKLADEALRGAELAKEDCMQREGENIKLLSATDGKLRGTTMRLADAEAVATALRGELQKLQAQLAETVSEKGKEVLNAADFEKALAMLKDKMESLNIKKKSEGQSADARDASLRAEVAELHKSMAARDQNLAEITTQLSTTSRELSAKVAAGEGAILMKEDKIDGLKSANLQLGEEMQAARKDCNVLTGQVLREQQAKEALARTENDLTKRCGELQGELLECQSKLRHAEAQLETLEVQRANLEEKLKAAAVFKVELNASMASKREVEAMNDTYQMENKRLLDVERRLRDELAAAKTLLHDAEASQSTDRMELLAKFSKAERELREATFDIINERDNLQAELNRFMALPNPNQIEVGDDLVEIDGCSVNGMTLEETRAKLTGKRSSKLTIKLMRETMDDGVLNGVTYTITLKRGAFGPEHSVVAPEDTDMRDAGRWPRAGAVTAAEKGSYDRGAIDNRKTSRLPGAAI
ncbi:hypothetical protein T484DRAFT_1741728 [Baffinella frigidus]|nr:hypothetical protein T484DRAFT_1741728 [Cryptophyta sp. CCMP2293]